MNPYVHSCLGVKKFHSRVDYALFLCDSSYSVRIADERPCNPIVPVTPEPCHTLPAKPEPPQVMPKPVHVMPTKLEPRPNVAATPESQPIMAAMPEESTAKISAAPEPCHAIATIPEPCHVTAAMQVSPKDFFGGTIVPKLQRMWCLGQDG